MDLRETEQANRTAKGNGLVIDLSAARLVVDPEIDYTDTHVFETSRFLGYVWAIPYTTEAR
jgi:hypothetical protein